MVLMLLSHLKKSVIPFLDELTVEAENTQSVNTIYLKDNKVVGT